MRYKITAPVAGFEGESAKIKFRDGIALIDTDVLLDRRALSYFRQAGYVVDEAEEPAEPVDLDGLGPVEQTTELLPQLPAPSASKTEWDDAAVVRGWSPEDAAKLSKTALVKQLRADEADRQPTTPPADITTEGQE